MAEQTGAPRRSEVLTQFRTEEILDAAIALINREGFAHLTMEQVAAAAGVAKGTVYLYFKDKDELLFRTILRLTELMSKRLETAISEELGIEEQLLQLARVLMDIVSENAEILEMVHRRGNDCCGEHSEEIHKHFHELLGMVSRRFTVAMKRGEIVPADTNLLAFLYLKLITTAAACSSQKKDFQIKADAQTLVDLFLNGISMRKE